MENGAFSMKNVCSPKKENRRESNVVLNCGSLPEIRISIFDVSGMTKGRTVSV
jgi:hypothetical protein